MYRGIVAFCGLFSILVIAVRADIASTSLGGQSALGSGVLGGPDGMMQGIGIGQGMGLGVRRLGGLQTGIGMGNAGGFIRRLDR